MAEQTTGNEAIRLVRTCTGLSPVNFEISAICRPFSAFRDRKSRPHVAHKTLHGVTKSFVALNCAPLFLGRRGAIRFVPSPLPPPPPLFPSSASSSLPKPPQSRHLPYNPFSSLTQRMRWRGGHTLTRLLYYSPKTCYLT